MKESKKGEGWKGQRENQGGWWGCFFVGREPEKKKESRKDQEGRGCLPRW